MVAAKSAATILMTAICLSPVMVSCDKYDDSALKEQIADIDNRLSALEEDLKSQVEALSAMLEGKYTIAGCNYDETTGIYTITLSDAKTVIEIPALGNTATPVISYVEQDGTKYWAVVSADGSKTPLTDASGNMVAVNAAIPALSLGEDGEWMISTDGKTWTGLGVTGEDVAIFTGVEEQDSYYVLTLADGTELQVAKADDSGYAFYPLAGKQFFNAGQTREVELVAEGITNTTVTEKPDGWKARTSGAVLSVTAPSSSVSDAEQSGVIKVLGVTADGASFISEVYVAVGEAQLTISVSFDQTVSIDMTSSFPYGGSFTYGATPLDEYSPSEIAEGISNYTIGTSSWEPVQMSLADILGAEPADGVTYVIWAAASNDTGVFTAGDIYYEIYQPLSVSIEVTSATVDDITLSVNVKGVSSYVPGFYNPDATDLATILTSYQDFGAEFEYSSSYEGSLSTYGSWGENLGVGTEYEVYVLPLIEGKSWSEYTVDDFICETVSTLVPEAGSSVTVSLDNFTSDFSTVSATASASGQYYKMYGAYLPAAEYSQYENDEDALAQYLISRGSLYDMTIRGTGLTPGAEGWIAAVAIDNDWKYTNVAVVEANAKVISFSDATVSVDDVEIGLTSVKVLFEADENVKSIRCLNVQAEQLNYNMNYGYGDISVIETYLAGFDPMSSWDGNIYDFTDLSSGAVEFTYLSTGVEYAFYMIGFDADGNPTRAVTERYTPTLSGTVIRQNGADGSPNPDYAIGSPKYTFTATPSGNFYDINCTVTEMPANCKEYYVGLVQDINVEDYYNSTIDVVTETMTNNGGPYTEPNQPVTVFWAYPEAYVGVVWVDTETGNYHQAYLTPCSDIIGTVEGGSGIEIVPGDNAK